MTSADMDRGAGEPEGRIRVRINTAAGRVARVAVDSTRKVHACRVLVGRDVDEALRCVPLLFSVCRTAQSLAAKTACEQAQGREPKPSETAWREWQLLNETLGEHCRTVLLAWPAVLDEAPAASDFVALYVALRQLQQEASQGRVAESSVRTLRGLVREQLAQEENSLRSEAALRAWALKGRSPAARVFGRVMAEGIEAFGRSDVAALPELDAQALEAALGADTEDALTARPHWAGRVYETGPLTRMGAHPLVVELAGRYGNGLLTRLAARLAELWAIMERIADLPDSSGPHRGKEQGDRTMSATGTGMGMVEAARGRLVHRVEVADGKVARYQILAPTEWNLHPEGALVRGLLGTKVRDAGAFRRRAALLVAALDPCVAYDVTVE